VQYLNTFHTASICQGFKYFHQIFVTTPLHQLVNEDTIVENVSAFVKIIIVRSDSDYSMVLFLFFPINLLVWFVQ